MNTEHFFFTFQSFCTDDNITTEQAKDTSSPFYTAAVVEFNAPGDELFDPVEIVDVNLEEYLQFIYEASEKGVDILVFPEGSLNYNGNKFHLETFQALMNEQLFNEGINSYENLTEVAVELQVEVPNVFECDFTHDAVR